MKNVTVTGTQVHYYHVCWRKLWLFSRNIQMEQDHSLVEIGKAIHETSYGRKKKEIQLDGIKIDLMEARKGLIHEVKKSKALEESHVWQLKYYLYHLKLLGLSFTGMIDYPLIRKRVAVELTENDERHIQKMIPKILAIVEDKTAPGTLGTGICRNCSYHDLCYI